MLIELERSVPVVCVSGIGGHGPILNYKVKQLNNLYIVGDGKADSTEFLAPRVRAAAAIQSNIVFNLLIKNKGDIYE